MTDVETKTPNKRRSSEKKTTGSAKKPKVTPKKENKILNKSNTAQNNKKNKKNNKNSESENGSPKKLKPFVGTSKIATPNEKQKGNKKVVEQNKEQTKGKKPRSNVFISIKNQINSNEKESALKSIEDKIKAIESRGELTKTAKRKLKLFYRLRKVAGGEGAPPQPQKAVSNKSELKNPYIENKEVGKTQLKGQKANKLNKKQAKVENKQVTKKGKQLVQVINEEEEEESSDEDEELDAEEDDSGSDDEQDEIEGESDDDSGEDEEGSEEESDDEEGEEEEDSDEDDSEEESLPPQDTTRAPKKNVGKVDGKAENKKPGSNVNLEDLKNNKLVGKNQRRFVLFVGNIPYDTNKHDLTEHFQKCGEIKHIRIPTEKKSSKPRGFGYVEVGNEESYQKCLSMHHTFLKGRRINVLYTQGGKKKGEDKKKEIKAKNFKLHAMRREGKLAGSKKESQKRSFRRAKNKAQNSQSQEQD